MANVQQRVVVVVPTFNERENLPNLISRLKALDVAGLEVLVVDDNSPDGTGQLADEYAAEPDRFVSVLHRTTKDGLGRAYVAGITRALEAGADTVIQMDADLSHPPEVIPAMIARLQGSDAALVIGSRYVPGGSVDAAWAWSRKTLSAGANWYVNAVLRLGIKDATAGYKVWDSATLRKIDVSSIRSNGYSFQVEMNYRTIRHGLSVAEYPIRFEERSNGTSKMNFAVQFESILMPWKLRLRRN
ncbi:polyprenol monophosphomannose synthase [Subtercola sp. RTI3]|uniref:polyprenol monophosphomannose synthase n=1 Tax=Subtercola sp. RTI3 TaxID=3048639 RepID=UPI002B232067|nr:polyprenol monophosphomannose synthase [Subtercola sp. RTI3]MEA9986147.1 polyprenol monophosphomannose synthase [Subtercola sp. RTI3]